MVFCNPKNSLVRFFFRYVTILILIDGFLQLVFAQFKASGSTGHNPYFNRWFSAIKNSSIFKTWEWCHNPYFNRWFSAIALVILQINTCLSHNPYFNRWFSAIF